MPLSAAYRPGFIGTRFGRLVVLGKYGLDKSRALVCRCLCDCGNEVNKRWSSLSRGYTKSCGCIYRERVKQIPVGSIFNRLTVQARAGSAPKSSALWECLCSCGNVVKVRGTNLRNGAIQSCGCLNREQASNLGKSTVYLAIAAMTQGKGVAALSQLLSSYKSQAKKRGLIWDLSAEDVVVLFKGDCAYCGQSPSQTTGKTTNNGKYIYNGIDRVDSKQGYIISNVVSCCGLCNWLKRDHPLDVLYVHIAKIVRRHPEILAIPL